MVVGNGFGFVGNRLMLPYMYEAQFLAEEGATPQQVDKVLTDFGMAMGIFAVDDMAGLDVAWRVRQEHPPFAAGLRQPLVADVLCEMGRFGQKTGAGWYRYAERPQGRARRRGRGAHRAPRARRRHHPRAVSATTRSAIA